MQRKEFIKRLGLSALMIPMVPACGNQTEDQAPAGDDCIVSPSETAGPFPTKRPSSLEKSDIRSDRTGVDLDVNITVRNLNASCAALADVIIDIWHCDKDGYYSEYGGTGMQSVNLQSVHFLRGRQVTNNDGLVSFKTIFPGWYSGRAPHVHVHIFDSSGKSLLVTQIAFPTDVCNAVYSTATQFYTRGTQDTSNTRDNVFSNSLSHQMSAVKGNVTEGFILTHSIVVSA